MTLSELNNRFAIPNVFRFEAGNGGLIRALITAPAAEVEMYLQGAHITRFVPRGQKPVLFMSEKSNFVPNKPIRGGVPICFPWFGPNSTDTTLPMHGWARLREWSVLATKNNSDGSATIVLGLQNPSEYSLQFTVTVGQTLEMQLQVSNIASQSLQFEEALHTYFAVGDVRKVGITGLENTEFLDKTRGGARLRQGNDPITITAETDRVYLNTQSAVRVHDPVFNRTLTIEKSGSNSTVVWNPWIDKAKAMPDFGDEEWPGMLCVETGNAKENAVTLEPGQTYTLRTLISASK